MNSFLLREWQIFLLSLSIFTRIPISADVPYSEERKNESYKYCGLVGLVIGILTAMVYAIAAHIWPMGVAVVLSMIFSVYITGAFHEDGFADTCDGFGGGFTPERKLEIMKDSRVGAYGLLGMVLILMLKFTILTSITEVATALIVAHVLSRSLAVSFIFTHGYVRQTEESKLKVAKSPSSSSDFAYLSMIALLTLVVFTSAKTSVLLILGLLILRWLCSRWMLRQVGGYTGDSLGAVQQMSEVVCYLMLFLLW
ncbi:adenosylcobinamide-GDP ribazoletransferase [Vibrio sp. SCSIO 43137]|uniref:adenosylcobinamide-GDP ribazoletransferase n=1 Tax=Vibrio sp. SCSIO 43137 TaxID=3021011 RepID=UPI0023079C47|nr:adenosylcobinamide-GDP ribazoletransferase [Vibrio sp. SCSIO 43137]WCE32483.1 adenosylcobinamide-GDP ribazoletransferase [Vibrio sp. SCSIO 43137]